MEISTKGLVIKEQKVGESDRLVTVLTEERGVIRAFARRANSIKDKNLSSTGLLTLSRFFIYCGRDKYIIKEASAVEVFFGLRKDIEKLSLAQYFCELVLSLGISENESKQILSVILNAIYMLCENKSDPGTIKSVVEMKLMSLCGFMPDITRCGNCQCFESDNMYLLPQKGVIYCENCYLGDDKTAMKLSQAALSAMRHIIYSPGNKMFNFKIKGESKKMLEYATEKYAQSVLNRKFNTLDFYKNILNSGMIK